MAIQTVHVECDDCGDVLVVTLHDGYAYGKCGCLGYPEIEVWEDEAGIHAHGGKVA